MTPIVVSIQQSLSKITAASPKPFKLDPYCAVAFTTNFAASFHIEDVPQFGDEAEEVSCSKPISFFRIPSKTI